jgi:hypothetical protein
MIVARLIAPVSKLATAKALDPATAASSLGAVLGLGEVDEVGALAATFPDATLGRWHDAPVGPHSRRFGRRSGIALEFNRVILPAYLVALP